VTFENELAQLRDEVEQLRTELIELRAKLEEHLSSQEVNAGDFTNRKAFMERVKTLLKATIEDIEDVNDNGKHRRRHRTQEDLANAIYITNSTLSRKLNGKERLLPGDVKRIVKQFLLWGTLDSRFAAREILGLMDIEDFVPAEYQEIEEKRGYNLSMHSLSKLDRLREDLSSREIDVLIQRIGSSETDYSSATIAAFIRERKESSQLRMIALELYLRIVSTQYRDSRVCCELLQDFDANVRKFTIQQIRKYNLQISNSDLERALNDSQQDVVLNAVELVSDLVRDGLAPARLLTLPNIAKHRYWRIRRLAIDGITEADPEYNKVDTVALLSSLQGVTVWSSRKRIVDYLCERFAQGNLAGDDVQTAISILEKYTNDGKSSKELSERASRVISLLYTSKKEEDV